MLSTKAGAQSTDEGMRLSMERLLVPEATSFVTVMLNRMSPPVFVTLMVMTSSSPSMGTRLGPTMMLWDSVTRMPVLGSVGDCGDLELCSKLTALIMMPVMAIRKSSTCVRETVR